MNAEQKTPYRARVTCPIMGVSYGDGMVTEHYPRTNTVQFNTWHRDIFGTEHEVWVTFPAHMVSRLV